MSLILKRIIMTLLVSFGLVALFVPFTLSGKEVVVDRQVVRLVFLGYTDDPNSPVPDLATATRISEEIPLAESIRFDMEKTSFPLADWTKTMGPIDGLTRIVYKGRLFEAEPRTEPHQKSKPGMIQPMDLRVFGAVVLALGLIAGRSLYRQMFSPGIPVCSPANVLAMDVVFVVFLGLCWIPMADFFLVHGFGTESMIGESRFHGMGFICAILATLTLGPYITAMSSQRVIVDADGIQIRSNLSEVSLSWDKLTEIRTADFHVPVGRIGTVLSRRAARVLRLEGDGRSAIILDPATKGGKRRIINAMLQHAPKTLSDMIRKAGETWEE